MRLKTLEEKLRQSNITPSTYIPSDEVKDMEHIVLTVNKKPLIGIGPVGDKDSINEADQLLVLSSLHEYIFRLFSTEDVKIEVRHIPGSEIDWKQEEVAISQKEIGKVEMGDEDGELHWIIFGDNAMPFAVALCVNEEIQKITKGEIK